MNFPYLLLKGRPRDALVPMIPIVYEGPKGKSPSHLVLVDSGASVSFAPIDLAVSLGIHLNPKAPLNIWGFNRVSTTCYPGQTTLGVAGEEISIPVYFGGDVKFQCVLGQDPFFDLARIVFERYNKTLSID